MASTAEIRPSTFWQRRFGGELTVVGKSVMVDGHSYTIVGVLGPKFTGTVVGVLPDVYLPLKTWTSTIGRDVADRSFSSSYLLGRRKPGSSLACWSSRWR